MNRNLDIIKMKHAFYRMTGQSSTGYIIATAVLVLALFFPWNGEPSVMVQFLNAVRDLYSNDTYVISLPN